MAAPKPKQHILDVRALIARGEEPFPKIIAAVTALPERDALVLISPFLPSPLIEKLQAEGFQSRPERRADGSWQTRFQRA